jgi:polyisoprenoid-binding protein YceI
MKIISAAEAQALSSKAIFIHVLPEEHYAQQHLPGAVNACVYEMVFLSKVAEFVPDKEQAIIVYGAGGPSLDSAVAAEKLIAAGYGQVSDLRGGLAEWISQGGQVEGTGVLQATTECDGIFALNVETSTVRWTGRNLFNHHHGSVQLAKGQIEIQNGTFKAASFTLDMNRITCDDLVDSAYNAMLIRHLRDDDFFAVDRFPSAEFICERAAPITSATEGTPNYTLHGKLTLRGVTQPLSFPAVIASADHDHLTGQAQFEIDRTQFGSHYGSGKLFAFLGKHVVNDHIHLHIKIQAARER